MHEETVYDALTNAHEDGAWVREAAAAYAAKHAERARDAA